MSGPALPGLALLALTLIPGNQNRTQALLLLLASSSWLWPWQGSGPAFLSFAVLLFLTWTWPLERGGGPLALAGPAAALLLSPPPLGPSRFGGGLWNPDLPWLLALSLLGPLVRQALLRMKKGKGLPRLSWLRGYGRGAWSKAAGVLSLRRTWESRPRPGPELAELLVLSLVVAAACL